MPDRPDDRSASSTTGRSRTFRLFVSSTFQDLRAERNALHAHVFPRLRELCRRHGCRFQAIDLRWGVSEVAALDQQTMTICLREIERCHRVTPRPNFLVLLGDRYGWWPPPPSIPADGVRRAARACLGRRSSASPVGRGAAGRGQRLVPARRERGPARVPAAPRHVESLRQRDARPRGGRAPGRVRGVGEDRGPTAMRARARSREVIAADGERGSSMRARPPSRRSPSAPCRSRIRRTRSSASSVSLNGLPVGLRPREFLAFVEARCERAASRSVAVGQAMPGGDPWSPGGRLSPRRP